MATNDKYDRQLRLWGAEGQRLLSEANILLIRADAVGSETLKNLVLPGLRSFTILDDCVVDESDLGNNFFCTCESKGKPRAEVVAQLLGEMNPDVTGLARVANFQNLLQTESDYFCKFTLIIASNFSSSHLLPLSELCWENNLPLLSLRSYGLVGSVRIQAKNHEIMNSREEGESHDLRLANPFPELIEYCQSFDLPSLDSMGHGHVPYPVLLSQALQRYLSLHPHAPKSYAEKEAFKQTIRDMARDFHGENNFQQAVKESYRAYTVRQPSDDLLALLEEAKDSGNAATSSARSKFSLLIETLAEFRERNGGLLPVAGTVPDMTSATDHFVRLQHVFQAKAQQDQLQFRQILATTLRKSGLSGEFISEEEVGSFCRQAGQVGVLCTSSISSELSSPNDAVLNALQEDLYTDPQQTPIIWYVALRAADVFHTTYARYPGQNCAASAESDAETLLQIMKSLAGQYQLPASVFQSPTSSIGQGEMEVDQQGQGEENNEVGCNGVIGFAHALEICRYAAVELHNISAIIGGIASQEAAKLLTHQFVPLNNTYVFNGIATCGATYSP